VLLWDAAARAATAELRLQRAVYALALLPDGRLAVSHGADIVLWAAAAPGGDGAAFCRYELQAVLRGGHSEDIASLSAGGGRLVSGGTDCRVCVWDAASGACVAVMRGAQRGGHSSNVYAVAALPGGRVASGGEDGGGVRVWALTEPGSAEDGAAEAAAREPAVVESGAGAGGASPPP